MVNNIGTTITTIGYFALSAMFHQNNYIDVPKTPSVGFEYARSVTSSTGIEGDYRFDYIEESFSLRDLSDWLIADSRGFTQSEANSYSNFIEDFFS